MRFITGLALAAAIGMSVLLPGAQANPQVCASAQDVEVALQACSEAIRNSPKNATLFANRGTIYHQKRDYDLAIADFTEA